MRPLVTRRPRHRSCSILSSLLAAGLFASGTCAADSYYKEAPAFHMWPDENAARWTIDRVGPIGIGLDLIQPAFTMRISNIEDGSPAAQTGELKQGQIIESINGKTLKDRDPRILLGDWITEAEASDGILEMMVKDGPKAAARKVVVRIPVMGAYSDTWPVNCPKSEKIIRNFADFLGKLEEPNHGAAMFLLSTGEQKDLDVVTGWFKDKLKLTKGGYPWDIGLTGPAICEYYLRTGDESVLPAVKIMADELKATIYNGAWAGRGGAPYGYMAGGHLNAAGVHCVTFLMLAKECGVDVDQHTFDTALEHFYRFAGHGNVAYGDGLPEGGFVDNGKTGGLAFAMAAAASLTPEGEDSVYAKARDISSTKSFYSTSWLFHGHTGGGIGELWRGAAMGYMKDKRAPQYRTFMDGRRWMYELARTWDGAFGWPSGWNVNYGQTAHKAGRAWGNYIPLVYTLPLKKLRIYGAPRSQFSKPFPLPKRPWGTAADEVFLSLQPGEYAPGKSIDITGERLATHASAPLSEHISDPKISDEELLGYAHHIDQGIRDTAARAINIGNRHHLVVPLLKSADPRGRRSGLACINGMFKGAALPDEALTDEMFTLAAAMIHDPEEAWWVVEGALNALGRAKPAMIEPHVDKLAEWLQHKEWWLRKAAMVALTPVAADQRYYRKILPIIGKMISSNERAVALQPVQAMVAQFQSADPEVQKFAVETLGEAYMQFPTKLAAPGGQDLDDGVDYLLKGIASNLAETPGGFDALFAVARARFPDQSLPHQEIFLRADSGKFGPEVKKALVPLIKEQLIPEYAAANQAKLKSEISTHLPDRTVAELVSLYERAGIDDYSWKLYGPKRTEIEWSYHSFDPDDGKLWERGWRYRPVEWPKGMEQWFAPGFDPKAAGWKIGRAPFGSTGGKLVFDGGCKDSDHFCGCGTPLQTLWEKEVLMMRAEITLPPLKEGHAYRILVGGRSHVNAGDGSDIWIDGERLAARRPTDPSLTGVGKRQGGQPWGRVIPDSFRPSFEDGKIILCASGFMNWANGKKANRQSFWLEEMKLPEITK